MTALSGPLQLVVPGWPRGPSPIWFGASELQVLVLDTEGLRQCGVATALHEGVETGRRVGGLEPTRNQGLVARVLFWGRVRRSLLQIHKADRNELKGRHPVHPDV